MRKTQTPTMFVNNNFISILLLLSISLILLPVTVSAIPVNINFNHHENVTRSSWSCDPDLDYVVSGELFPNQSIIFSDCTIKSLELRVLFHPGSTLILDKLYMHGGSLLVQNFTNQAEVDAHSYCQTNSSMVNPLYADSRFTEQIMQVSFNEVHAKNIYFAPSVCGFGFKEQYLRMNISMTNLNLTGAKDVEVVSTPFLGQKEVNTSNAVLHLSLGSTYQDPSLPREKRNYIALEQFILKNNHVQCLSTKCGSVPSPLVAVRNSRFLGIKSNAPPFHFSPYDPEDGTDTTLVRGWNAMNTPAQAGSLANPSIELLEENSEVVVVGNHFEEKVDLESCPNGKLNPSVPTVRGIVNRYDQQNVMLPLRFLFSPQMTRDVYAPFLFKRNTIVGFSMSEIVRLNAKSIVSVIGESGQLHKVMLDVSDNVIRGLPGGQPDRISLVIASGTSVSRFYAGTPIVDVDGYTEIIENLTISNNTITTSHNCLDDPSKMLCVGQTVTVSNLEDSTKKKVLQDFAMGQVGLWLMMQEGSKIRHLNIIDNDIKVTRGPGNTAMMITDYDAISNFLTMTDYNLYQTSTRQPLPVADYNTERIKVQLLNLNIRGENSFYCNSENENDQEREFGNKLNAPCLAVLFPNLHSQVGRDSFHIGGSHEMNKMMKFFSNRSFVHANDMYPIFVKIYRLAAVRPTFEFIDAYVENRQHRTATSLLTLSMFPDPLSQAGINATLVISNIRHRTLNSFHAASFSTINFFIDRYHQIVTEDIRVDLLQPEDEDLRRPLLNYPEDAERSMIGGAGKAIRATMVYNIKLWVVRNFAMRGAGRSYIDLMSFVDDVVDVDEFLIENTFYNITIPPALVNMSESVIPSTVNPPNSMMFDFRSQIAYNSFAVIEDRYFRRPTKITIRNATFFCERNICIFTALATAGIGDVVIEDVYVKSRSHTSGNAVYINQIIPPNDLPDTDPYAANNNINPFNVVVRNSFFEMVDTKLALLTTVNSIQPYNRGTMKKYHVGSVTPNSSLSSLNFFNVTAHLGIAQFSPPFPVVPEPQKMDPFQVPNEDVINNIVSMVFIQLYNSPVLSLTFKEVVCRGCAPLTSLLLSSLPTTSKVSFLGGDDVPCNKFVGMNVDSSATAGSIISSPDPLFFQFLNDIAKLLIRQPSSEVVEFESCVNPSRSVTVSPSQSLPALSKTESFSFYNDSNNSSNNTNSTPTTEAPVKNEERDEVEVVSDGILTTGGAISIVSPSPAGAGSFSRVRSVLSVVNGFARGKCEDEDEERPTIAESPLQLKIEAAGRNGKWSAGMIIGNLVLFLGLFVLFVSAFYLYQFFSSGHQSQKQSKKTSDRHHLQNLDSMADELLTNNENGGDLDSQEDWMNQNGRYARRMRQQQRLSASSGKNTNNKNTKNNNNSNNNPDFGRTWHSYSLLEAVSRSQAGGVLVFGALMFLTPTVQSMMLMFIRSEVNITWKILSLVFTLIFVALISYYTYWGLSKREAKYDKYVKVTEDLFEIDQMLDGFLMINSKRFANFVFRIVGPEGEWEISSRAPYQDKVYFGVAFPLLEGYLKRFPKFFFVEILVLFLLGLAPILSNTISGMAGCFAHAGFVLAILFVFLIILLKFRPYVDLLSRVATPATTIIEMVTIIIAMAGAEVNVLDSLMLAMASMQLIISVLAFLFWFLSFMWPFLRKILRKITSGRGKKVVASSSSSSSKKFHHQPSSGSNSRSNDRDRSTRGRRNLRDLDDDDSASSPVMKSNNNTNSRGRSSRRDRHKEVDDHLKPSAAASSSSSNHQSRRSAARSSRSARESDGDEMLLQYSNKGPTTSRIVDMPSHSSSSRNRNEHKHSSAVSIGERDTTSRSSTRERQRRKGDDHDHDVDNARERHHHSQQHSPSSKRQSSTSRTHSTSRGGDRPESSKRKSREPTSSSSTAVPSKGNATSSSSSNRRSNKNISGTSSSSSRSRPSRKFADDRLI